MPTYRGISISLQSQYDALTIPEFPSPSSSAPATPPKCRLPNDRSVSSFSSPGPPRIAVVYVPIYSGSQFWINYACPTTEDAETKFYYFKLFVKGRCLLSWGVGQEDDLSGRVAFALFDGGKDVVGKQIFEKRSFFFHNADTSQGRGGNFEIKVFRSKARKREPARFEKFAMNEGGGRQDGFNILASGRMKKGDPRKMYTYALIDPKNQPFATFRYHSRTGTQLRELGITLPGDDNADDIMTASPSRRDRSPISPIDISPPARECAGPPRPSLDSPGKAMHPLSITPPRMRLSPTKPRNENMSPRKRSMGAQPHQDFLQGIGGVSLGEPEDINRNVGSLEHDNNIMTVSPAKQREDAERSAGAAVVRSLSSAVRSIRRRVGSREEHKPCEKKRGTEERMVSKNGG